MNAVTGDEGEDRPRLFRSPAAIARREAQIDMPHVAPLNNWVRGLRKRLSAEAIVPWFDPGDGGVDAQILFLAEAPGGKATKERGGSGFVSCNNNDGTAENTWRTRDTAGVPRDLVVHWNVIPYYLGDDTKIRAYQSGDVAAAGPLLVELISLMPKLKVVILAGGAAQSAWATFAPPDRVLDTIDDCPHPSPTNLNTRPGNRERVVEAWHKALAQATPRP